MAPIELRREYRRRGKRYLDDAERIQRGDRYLYRYQLYPTKYRWRAVSRYMIGEQAQNICHDTFGSEIIAVDRDQ